MLDRMKNILDRVAETGGLLEPQDLDEAFRLRDDLALYTTAPAIKLGEDYRCYLKSGSAGTRTTSARR